MRYLYLLIFIFFSQFVLGQFSLKLVVTQVATKEQDDIYVAGNFNNWNPADPAFKLKPFGGTRKGIVIKNLSPGNYAFKLTRGSWDKVETTADGRDINDRMADVTTDITQEITVAGWKDDYPDKPKPFTASPNVRILDNEFFIPQLNRKRRVWIYLPKNYATSGKTYPVIYMQDGQNLFNEQTAFNGEWGVDECLDSVQRITQKECIVVGIDNGGDKRLQEYTPYNFSFNNTTITAEGEAYVQFIINTLKPFIDSKYRTKKTAEFTTIAGSSMGALISYYAILKYPQIFGNAGIFSPSFFVSEQVYKDAEAFNSKNNVRLYLYAGGKESASLVSEVKRVASILAAKDANYQITTSIDPNGEHKEKYWRTEFARFYSWLYK